jgi:hypothetical protein
MMKLKSVENMYGNVMEFVNKKHPILVLLKGL